MIVRKVEASQQTNASAAIEEDAADIGPAESAEVAPTSSLEPEDPSTVIPGSELVKSPTLAEEMLQAGEQFDSYGMATLNEASKTQAEKLQSTQPSKTLSGPSSTLQYTQPITSSETTETLQNTHIATFPGKMSSAVGVDGHSRSESSFNSHARSPKDTKSGRPPSVSKVCLRYACVLIACTIIFMIGGRFLLRPGQWIKLKAIFGLGGRQRRRRHDDAHTRQPQTEERRNSRCLRNAKG